ncbi:D-alanyl-D-alanine carboxypeptidase/D-alanyl-D-alanine-endopeptidase [Mycobacteroides abscessus]|uniref:D-alanyl-D-alanine carboxypeptidase/D-alanyl-D-alanine-endopeptidase n=1 Tax=Mycobacteroides abscessus subsp. massiliense TaxID=1962118 RepID=A0A1T8PYD3_9MYCO|nr:D-alanyl-D-alanine carboxypeptidase/D-alanyl-D-alanine-endopeptidase [Mycobacteroides abscessus]AMU64246.1 D-alanyl-D-alanine carboxypeptidase [Mycobacteroides abscessus]ANO12857.1 D-alanyl-D-alanine carboxypeptidase/D-alanyl-D-alanine-endopeptidase [Mycobacteroides abscessus]ARQ63130.1 D-alanyl-D-alanine carboxypeptidase/D-alanyl-D-alanine-endopeptidase [Mycobacteroides abscessus subsp. massiliense]EIV69359.1 D-alanyl-D-alanine carboxypeptidase/D-alanyl-D-alanine-endopeptidase [Mycobacteroi
MVTARALDPRHWRRSTHALLAVAVVLAIAALVLLASLTTGASTAHQLQSADPEPTLVIPAPGVVPVSDSAPVPTADGLAQALDKALSDPALGMFTGRVTDALTGRELWQQGSTVPMVPASTNKVLTAAAALLTLERDAKLTTSVVADTAGQRGLVTLVGGGDPIVSAAPAGTDTWYRDAARISDLADQVRKSGVAVTSITVDISRFGGPSMAPGWDPADIEGGDVAPIQAVMLDAGRTQPTDYDSRRSTTPALDAGRALATALGVDPEAVRLDAAPPTAKSIASVQSAPLMERLREMMNASDNVMAETIGREVALATGRAQTFSGTVDAVTSQLRSAGIDLTDLTLRDSSGLSVDDRVTARMLDEVIGAAAGPDKPKLRPLLDVLPIAGGSGTLSERFVTQNQTSAGWLRAKTGSLTGVNTLAGVVTDVSGRVLTFSLMQNHATAPTARNAVDNTAAVLRSCGCS